MKTSSKCCITCLVIVLVLVILAGIGIGVFLNMTPRKMKIADSELIGGKTYEDLGIADIKIKDFIKGLAALINFNEENVITNAFDDNVDGKLSKDNLAESSAAIDGTVSFRSLLKYKAEYWKTAVKVYTDRSIAYIMNSALQSSTSFQEENWNTLRLEIVEVVIANNGTPHANVSFKIPTGISEDNSYKLPDQMVVSVSFDFEVNELGEVSTKEATVKVLDGSKLASALFEKLVNDAVPPKTTGEETVDGMQQVTDGIMLEFRTVMNNLGRVGQATAGADGVVIGVPTYGNAGVTNGSVSFITHKKGL